MANHAQPQGKQSQEQALVGQVLQGYLLEQQVGRGGMAWIYRAKQLSTQAYVALKILFPHLAETPEFRKRFLEEAYIQYEINHPHIVQVLDAINQPPFFGTVLEWANLRDLKFWLKRGGRSLDFQGVWSLMNPLLDALALAHERGVIHRDLKPDNVLFHFDGRQIVPKLGDFGVAKLLNEANSNTVTGSVLGTPKYMSPEQIMDSKKVDQRSDVYSLGILLYRIATGTLPFRQKSALALMRQHESEPPPLPSTYNPHIAPMLETIILRCLEKKPERRYPSCRVLQEALRGLPNLRLDQTDAFARQLDIPANITLLFLDQIAQESYAASAPTQDEPASRKAQPLNAPNPWVNKARVEAPSSDSLPQSESASWSQVPAEHAPDAAFDSPFSLHSPPFSASSPTHPLALTATAHSENFLRILSEQGSSPTQPTSAPRSSMKAPAATVAAPSFSPSQPLPNREIDEMLGHLPDVSPFADTARGQPDSPYADTFREQPISSTSGLVEMAKTVPDRLVVATEQAQAMLAQTIPERRFSEKTPPPASASSVSSASSASSVSSVPSVSSASSVPSVSSASSAERRALSAFSATPASSAQNAIPYTPILPDEPKRASSTRNPRSAVASPVLRSDTSPVRRPGLIGLLLVGGGLGLLLIVGVLFSSRWLPTGPSETAKKQTKAKELYAQNTGQIKPWVEKADAAWKRQRYAVAAQHWRAALQVKGWENSAYSPGLFEAMGGAMQKLQQPDASIRYFEQFAKHTRQDRSVADKTTALLRGLREQQKHSQTKRQHLLVQIQQAIVQKDIAAAQKAFAEFRSLPMTASSMRKALLLLSPVVPSLSLSFFRRITPILDLTTKESAAWAKAEAALLREDEIAQRVLVQHITSLVQATQRSSEAATLREVRVRLQSHGSMPLFHLLFFQQRRAMMSQQARHALRLQKAYQKALEESLQTSLSAWLAAFALPEAWRLSSAQDPITQPVWESKALEEEAKEAEAWKRTLSLLEQIKRLLGRSQILQALHLWKNLPPRWIALLETFGEDKASLVALQEMTRIFQEITVIHAFLADAAPSKGQQQVLLLMDDMNARRESVLKFLSPKSYEAFLEGLKILLRMCSDGQQILQSAEEAYTRKEWKEAEQHYRKYLREMPRKTEKNWLHQRIHACQCAQGAGWASCKDKPSPR